VKISLSEFVTFDSYTCGVGEDAWSLLVRRADKDVYKVAIDAGDDVTEEYFVRKKAKDELLRLCKRPTGRRGGAPSRETVLDETGEEVEM
jgi:hypothetical protein